MREEILDLYGEAIALPSPHADAEPRETAIGDSSGEVGEFFDVALKELGELRGSLNLAAISRTVEIIRTALGRGGRVHVTGVGKPEHVARYAASLFCSVGTPATFLHATETLHGSLGQVHPRDVVIAISNSGITDELLSTATAIREQGAQLIAITGNKDSGLAQVADLVIHAPVTQEGGGLGLAPANQRTRRSLRAGGIVGSARSRARIDGRGIQSMASRRRNRRSGTTVSRRRAVPAAALVHLP